LGHLALIISSELLPIVIYNRYKFRVVIHVSNVGIQKHCTRKNDGFELAMNCNSTKIKGRRKIFNIIFGCKTGKIQEFEERERDRLI
jgi:hypothetical protein